MDKTRVCKKCKKIKPLTKEYWHKGENSKDGFLGKCKVCRNKESKEYRENNKDYFEKWRKENKEYIREYYKEHGHKYKGNSQEYRKRYYQENKEHLLNNHRKWSAENKDYVAKRSNEYYHKNKEEIKRKRKQLYEANKEHMQESARRRMQKYIANKKQLPSTLTQVQWEDALMYFDNSCAYCGMTRDESKFELGSDLHQEHFIPLSKGGEYTHNNIIPSCGSCNSSKKDNDFFDWYPKYRYYTKEREECILEYLGYTKNIQQLSIL